MGIISPYCSDEEVVASLRQYYNKNEQYKINFYHALSTARRVKDGVLVTVGSRQFLLHEVLGVVLREVKSGCGTSVC